MPTTVTAFPYSGPPRVEVFVQGSTAARVNVYRLSGNGQPVLVRGAIRLAVTDPLAVVDNEAPPGVPVVYSVQELDALGQPTANITSSAVTIAESGTWLSQPLYPERWVKIDQLEGSFASQAFTNEGEHVRPGDREAGLWLGTGKTGVRGTLAFSTDTLADQYTVQSMFGNPGERVPPILCLRSTLPQRLASPLYILVQEPSLQAGDWHAGGELTTWSWGVEQTSMPSPAIVVPGYTYQDLEAAYASSSYTQLQADHQTYSDIERRYDLGGL